MSDRDPITGLPDDPDLDDDSIELQGGHRDRLPDLLEAEGFAVG